MAISPLACKTILSPNHYQGRTHKITKITPHHMAGNLTIEQCGAVFAPTSRQASSNYGIGTDGRIACYVDENNAAWTSSSYTNDNQAVTIEVADTTEGVNSGSWAVSDAAWNSLVNLCVDICQRNRIERLVYTGDATGNLTEHLMFAPTGCPGPYLHARMSKLAEEVNKRLEGDIVTEADMDKIAKKTVDELLNRPVAVYGEKNIPFWQLVSWIYRYVKDMITAKKK